MRARRFGRITYWVLAGLVTSVLLWQTHLYLHVPGARTWQRVSRTVRNSFRPGDEILFDPSWLAGYALDKNRFLGLLTSEQALKDMGDSAPGARLWVISAFSEREYRPPAGVDLQPVLRRKVDEVHIRLFRPRPP